LSLFEPGIGGVPVNELTPPEMRMVLEKVQGEGKRETARRMRSFADRIMRFAIGVGYAKENPAKDLGEILLTPRARNHAAIIDQDELGKLLRAIDGASGYPSTHAALKLSPHVFQRPGEIRQMKWADLDLDAGKWTLDAAETKMRREHEVPLSRQAVEIIRSMKYVFPAFHTFKRPLSENTINQALKRLGYGGAMTAHGFRATASTLLNGSGKWRADVIECALAHKDTNGIRSIYNRSPYWDERTEMMQWWSDELDRLRKLTKR
jgi:integrase